MGIKAKRSAQDDRETINLLNEIYCQCLPAKFLEKSGGIK